MMRIVSVSCLLAFSVAANADDWPQWRGINRDATLTPAEQIDSLPSGIVNRKWTVEIGGGYSGPTMADGRVYVTDRGPSGARQQIERILCFNAADGKPIWEHSYESKYTVGYTAGPRAAVTIHDGKAFAVGAMGHFHCLDAKTGDVLWQHDLEHEYDIRMPIWGITAAPLVYQNLAIQVTAGAGNACLVAFDIESGEERWRAIDERAGYSSPVLIRQGDQDVVVAWTGESISGVDPLTGKVFWSIPMLPTKMPIGVPTPVIDGNLIFVSSFYDGSMLIEFDPNQPTAKKAWFRIGQSEKNTDALHCMISNPIIKGDHIYGVDSYGELRCLDKQTGDRVWMSDQAVRRNRWATIHTIKNGDQEIMLNEQGELISATLSPDGYTEHSRAKLIAPTKLQLNRRDGVVWAHPAIADGHIYARSDRELVCAPLKSE
jgi:outer membrane protein assembly factor BamB